MKRGLKCFYLLVLVIFSFSVYASIFTSSFTPTSASLCGSNSETLELTASMINNTGAFNYTNVDAVLVLLNSSLSYVTDSTVSLGPINVSSQSSVNPSWTIKCTNQSSIQTSLIYVVYVTNSGNFSSLSHANSTVKIYTSDVKVPSVLNSIPSGSISNSYATLEMTTDENAICKYSTSSGVSYSSMSNKFSSTGNTLHRQTVENLLDGYHNYYVKCSDYSDNVMSSDYIINFNVNSPPSVIITLNPKSPLKEGLVKVNLTTSEAVIQSPTLKFTYDGSTFTNIPLTGSGVSWMGFLTITSSSNGKVGSLIFEGEDFDGKKGTVITSGNLFLVDTQPPLAPGSINVEKFDDDLKISWVHSGEDVIYYNLYRTKTSGQYSNAYVNTTGKSYIDSEASKNETYFYKVSAVDAAGNEGTFSSEGTLKIESTSVTSTSTSVNGNSEVSTQVQAEEVKEVDIQEIIVKTSLEIDTLLDQLSDKQKDLKEVEKSKAFLLLKIDELIKQRRTELLKIKKELSRIKPTEKKDVLDDSLKTIELIKKETIVGIEYGTEVKFDFNSNETDIAVDEIIKYEGVILEEEDIKDYKEEVTNLQKKVKVEITPLIIEHLDKSKENYLLVKKVVETNGLDDVVIIEVIPKTIVKDVSSLAYENNVVVINSDPVLRFETNEIYYIIKKEVGEDLVKETNLVLLPDYKKFLGVKEEKGFLGITGFAVGGISDIDFENVAIAVGLILFLLGGFYYLRMDSSDKEYVTKEKNKGKNRKEEKVSYLNYGDEVVEKNEFVPLISLVPKGQEVAMSKVKPLNYANLPYLLEQAETYAHSWKFEEALKLYKMMLVSSDKKMEGNTKKQFSRFYKKMCLMMKVKKLEESVSGNDPVSTNYLLNDVAKMYNDLLKGISDPEKEFMKSVSNYHKSYSNLFTK